MAYGDARQQLQEMLKQRPPRFLGPPIRQDGSQPPPPPVPHDGPGFDGGPTQEHQRAGNVMALPKDKSERRMAYSHDKDYARALQSALKRQKRFSGHGGQAPSVGQQTFSSDVTSYGGN